MHLYYSTGFIPGSHSCPDADQLVRFARYLRERNMVLIPSTRSDSLMNESSVNTNPKQEHMGARLMPQFAALLSATPHLDHKASTITTFDYLTPASCKVISH